MALVVLTSLYRLSIASYLSVTCRAVDGQGKEVVSNGFIGRRRSGRAPPLVRRLGGRLRRRKSGGVNERLSGRSVCKWLGLCFSVAV